MEKKKGHKPKTSKKRKSKKSVGGKLVKTDKTFKRIDELIRRIQTYPVISNDDVMIEAKSELVRIYKGGPDNVRQTILFIIHNLIFELDDIRQPQSTKIIKRREQISEDVRLRVFTYQRMFNYNTSFEGINEIIEILTMLDDNASAKILTHFLSHVLTIESEGYRMLRNDVFDALGKMTNMYALKSLLYYHSVVSSEQLSGKIEDALNMWRKKLGKLDISKQERKILLQSIDGKIGHAKDNPTSQYR